LHDAGAKTFSRLRAEMMRHTLKYCKIRFISDELSLNISAVEASSSAAAAFFCVTTSVSPTASVICFKPVFCSRLAALISETICRTCFIPS